MKGFWNNKDGINEKDFEKLVLGVLFVLCILATLYKYIASSFINELIVWLDGTVGSLFVVRKVSSYYKPERYNKSKPNNTAINDSTDNNAGEGNDA